MKNLISVFIISSLKFVHDHPQISIIITSMLFTTENILTSLGILLHDVCCICREIRKQCSGTQNKPWDVMLILWQKVSKSRKSVDRKWEVRDVHLEVTSHWPKCVEERRYLSRGPCYYQLVAKCWESSLFAWFQLHVKWAPLALPAPSFIVIISQYLNTREQWTSVLIKKHYNRSASLL